MRNLLQDLNLVFDTFKNFPDLNQDRKIDFSDFKVGYETITDFTQHYQHEIHLANHLCHDLLNDRHHFDTTKNTHKSEPDQNPSPTANGWIWNFDLDNQWKYDRKIVYYSPS